MAKLPYADLPTGDLPAYGESLRGVIDTFETDEWGVPMLDLKRQGKLVEPVLIWGEQARTLPMPGTWLFYTHDYKFNHVIKYPLLPLISNPTSIGEINFSTFPGQPRAQALWDICQKRTISRLWQYWGYDVIVDLCVEPEFSDLTLRGVPHGWRSYVTRGYNRHSGDLVGQYFAACDRARTDEILFVCYGGGMKVHQLALEHNWTFIPERMRRVEAEIDILSHSAVIPRG